MKSEFYGTEIFLDNEATREYLDICRASLKRGDDGYYHEEHMVIPMDFWRFLPWAVKGKLNEAMPKDKIVYCKLTPEEHFRCHDLLAKMVPEKTKERCSSLSGLQRLKRVHKGKYETAEEWGRAQRRRNLGKDWSLLPETAKYHPELYDGSS